MSGWQTPTSGITSYSELPAAAKRYLIRIEELLETPVDIVSTGPGREAVIIRRHPFDAQ